MIRRTSSAVLIAAALSALGVRAQGAASDWPRFRGPANDGVSSEKGIAKDWKVRPPRPLWQVPMHDSGFAGPAVARGLVYIVDHDGGRDVVRALRMADGSEAWRFAYEDTNREVYGFARSTPAVEGGRVYTVSRLGLLHCLNARTGKLVWRRDTVGEFHGRRPMWDVAASPLVDHGKVIVFPGGPDAAIAALDAATGRTLWAGGGSEKPGYATPVAATVDGTRQYVTMDAAGAVGYRAADGARLWHFDWPTRDGTNVAAPIFVDGGVFITSAYGMGCALLGVRGGRAEARWRSDAIAAHVNTPVLVGGMLYGTSEPSGSLVCMDPRTGRALWKQPGSEKGGIVAVDGVLLVLDGARGDLVMVRPGSAGYDELGRIRPLGGQSWSPPIVADGKVLVRNRGALACLALQ